MHQNDRRADLVEQRRQSRDRVGAGAGQRALGVRHELRDILVERIEGELRAGVRGWMRRPDAEEHPGEFARGDQELRQGGGVPLGLGTVDRRRIEAGARAAGVVHHVDREALARKVGRPAFAPVRRRFVGGLGVDGARHHDDRRPAHGLGDEILDVHLAGPDLPGRNRAGEEGAGDGSNSSGRPPTKKLPKSCSSSGPPSEPPVAVETVASRSMSESDSPHASFDSLAMIVMAFSPAS